MLSVHRILQCLEYNPNTGIFTRKIPGRGFGAKVGDVAGSPDKDGYLCIGIDGKVYRAHRIAYLISHGEIDRGMEIDHINGIKNDNRASNLRKVSSTTNKENLRAAHSRNKLGVLGVRQRSDYNKFEASIQVNGKKKHLGVFDTSDAASEAYLCAKRNLHLGCTI